MHLLAILLLWGTAAPIVPDQNPEPADDVLILGPVRDVSELIATPPALPDGIPVPPARSHSFTVTAGWAIGTDPPYESYPLPAARTQSQSMRIASTFVSGRWYATADVRKRLNGSGWSLQGELQFRLFSINRYAVSAVTTEAVGTFSDLLYRSPDDIGLGMRRTSSFTLLGFAGRMGTAERPVLELSVLGGRNAVAQTPELLLDGTLVEQQYSKILSQNAEGPVVAVRIRSTRQLTRRLTLSGAVGYAGWFRRKSLLVPDVVFTAQGTARYDIWDRWAVDLTAQWSSDHRGSSGYFSSLILGFAFR